MRPEQAGSRKVRRLCRFCAVSLGVSSGALLPCTVHPAGYGSPGFLSMSRLTTLKPRVGVSGQRFGRLTATEPAGRAASGHASAWLLGYTATDLHRHLERQFLPGMTWQNRAQWHIDHIVPMSTASTIEDVVRLNQLPNLRPMWAGENLRKRDQRTHLV